MFTALQPALDTVTNTSAARTSLNSASSALFYLPSYTPFNAGLNPTKISATRNGINNGVGSLPDLPTGAVDATKDAQKASRCVVLVTVSVWVGCRSRCGCPQLLRSGPRGPLWVLWRLVSFWYLVVRVA